MRSGRFRHDDGASLVIVLIFVTVFGLIVAALLTQAGASVAYTTVVRDHEKKVYAADAGISLGIQQLQQNNEICPVTGSSEEIHTVTVNGIVTRVECETISGSTTGGLGYAIYTRSPASDSLQLQSGAAKEVNGPVYVTGGVGGLNKGLIVERGNFGQLQAHGCNAHADSGVTVETGFSKLCRTAPPTIPSFAAPAVPPAPIAAQLSGVSCKIFYPGTYEDAPVFDLAKTNYFATGTYYFKTSFTFEGQGIGGDTYYFGGTPAGYEEPKFSLDRPACASDAEAADRALPLGGYTASGTGVQFIFGNGAVLTIHNKSRAELFERTADGTQERSSPSIVAVPSASSWPTPDWQPNPADTTAVQFTSGADKALVVHGLTYAPDHNVVFKVTNIVDAVAFGGVVAWKVDLQSSEGGGGGGLVVSAKNGKPSPRHIVVRATSPFPPSAGDGREVVSTAVVQIANNAARSVTINSWRTRAPDEAL